MGTVYRETFTKPLPPGAVIFTRKGERFARWTNRRGRKRTAKVTTPTDGKYAGTDRVLIKARTFTAKYRNGAGRVCKVATGCRSADAALAVLAELEKRPTGCGAACCPPPKLRPWIINRRRLPSTSPRTWST